MINVQSDEEWDIKKDNKEEEPVEEDKDKEFANIMVEEESNEREEEIGYDHIGEVELVDLK